MKKVGFLILATGLILLSTKTYAALSANADALITIIKQLSITFVDDLRFDQKIQGEGSDTVLPGDAGAASFTVNGQANTAYSITLPASVTMTTGDGIGATKQIVVNSFAHDQGGTPTLDGDGIITLKVGATHAAIANDQEPGSYSGTFTVDVAY
jgi:hypothetical protein